MIFILLLTYFVQSAYLSQDIFCGNVCDVVLEKWAETRDAKAFQGFAPSSENSYT